MLRNLKTQTLSNLKEQLTKLKIEIMSNNNQYVNFLNKQTTIVSSNKDLTEANTEATQLLSFAKNNSNLSTILKNFKGIEYDLVRKTQSVLHNDKNSIYQLFDYTKNGINQVPDLAKKITELKHNTANTQGNFEERVSDMLKYIQNEMPISEISHYLQKVNTGNNEILAYDKKMIDDENQRLARQKSENEKMTKNIFITIGVIVGLVVIVPILIEHWVAILVIVLIIGYFMSK